MRRTQLIEAGLIVLALVSLWPVLLGYRALWYSAWLGVMLAVMIWVAVRQLRRIRAAINEAKRKRDEAEKSGRPPFLGS